MKDVVKSLSTRSFFQLCSDLKREHYNNVDNINNSQKNQLWISVFIMFVFFIWAVYALIKYQRDLPGWVVVLGIILLFIPAGPLLTLILVYYSLGALGEKKAGETLEESMTVVEGDEGGGKLRKLRGRPSTELPSGNPPLVRRPGYYRSASSTELPSGNSPLVRQYGTRGGGANRHTCPHHSRGKTSHHKCHH